MSATLGRKTMNAKWFKIALIFILPTMAVLFRAAASAPADKPNKLAWQLKVGTDIPEAEFGPIAVDAAASCQTAVERHAKYDLRWTDSWSQPKFFDSIVSKHVHQDGLMLFYGDRAEAQNGLGAWVRVRYNCTYNPFTKAVTDASLEPGHY
jgi:hypothetical protein